MSKLELKVTPASTVGDLSNVDEFVGHLTVNVANTTFNQTWDGVVILETKIGDYWVESDTLNAEGVFPGFNAIKGEYRLRLETLQTTGSADITVYGFENPQYIPY